jgi:ABC-type amino acid transport substrate-binding protein
MYSKEKLITEREMEFPIFRPLANIQPVILDKSGPNPIPIADGQTRIERIRQRGVIRIGFDPTKMPFAYFSANDQLIGFDIEMAYYLADDLHVNIEFVPIASENLTQQLNDDHFDIAMSAIEGTVNQAAEMPSIDSYMDVTLAIVVPDHEKRDYRTRDAILSIPDLKLAVIKNSFFADRAPKVLPENVKLIELDSANEYFEGAFAESSGLVISAESGSAWTLRYPEFTVVNPLQSRVRVPLYYLTTNEPEFQLFLQNWLTLRRSDGVYQQLYDYWVLGEDNQKPKPRWCILRNVLHWVD